MIAILLLGPVAHADPERTFNARSDNHDAAPTERRRSYVHTAWTLGAFGVIGGVTGVATGMYASSLYHRQFDNGNCSAMADVRTCNLIGRAETHHAQTLGNIGTGIAFTGAALLATGAIIYFIAPRDSMIVTPTASTESAGLAVIGRF
ncbi:MAG: hypothetical protein JWO36_2094 [Myxococcales bacterium]|nr:hypothetical protein [Myxococcales bacterium]